MFQKATRSQAKLRICLEGASGSGKTEGALNIATAFGRTAVIDTERSSASLYADRFEFDTAPLDPPYTPERYIEMIRAAEDAGYDIIVIDSITHEWAGQGGCLEIQSKLGGKYQDWAKVTPRHDAFVQAILGSKCHIIVTCRSKQDYAFDPNTKKVEKLGMAPQQREGLDFEMTAVFLLNQNHMATALKDRTRLFDGKDQMITKNTGTILLNWLNSGEKAKPSLKDAYATVIKRDGMTRDKVLGLASETLGKPVQSASDILPAEVDRVLKAWGAA